MSPFDENQPSPEVTDNCAPKAPMSNCRDSLVFNISRAKNARQTAWTLQSLTFDQFVDLLSNHRPDRIKDGPAFVPGSLIGTGRKKEAVAILYFLVYDVDGKQSLAEVSEKVALTGRYAHIYTTYSHRKAQTFIKSDHYHNWATKSGLPTAHTEENVLRYLQEHDLGHLKNVVFHDRMKHTADGLSIYVDHDPLDKVRIVYPLKVPFVFANNGHTSAQAIQVWKRFYHGVGRAIGLDFDVSCADPSRLYYLPSHPEDVTDFANLVVDNDAEPLPFLNYLDYEQAPIEAILDRATSAHTVLSTGDAVESAVSAVSATSIDSTTRDNLKRFFVNYGKTFQLATALETRGDAPAHGMKDTGELFIDCPYEELHTTHGNSTRTMAANGNGADEKHCGITCLGSHCHGRDRIEFFAKMLEDGWLTWDDLKNPALGGGPFSFTVAGGPFTGGGIGDEWPDATKVTDDELGFEHGDEAIADLRQTALLNRSGFAGGSNS
jgi:hypothetical protein